MRTLNDLFCNTNNQVDTELSGKHGTEPLNTAAQNAVNAQLVRVDFIPFEGFHSFHFSYLWLS